MKYSSVNRGFSAGNPIANIFVIVVGALAIAVSVVLGFFAFIVLGSIVAVLAAVVGIRLWWLNRSLRRQGAGPGSGTHGVIEGEFHVVDENQRIDRES